jgi:hypothetical protein
VGVVLKGGDEPGGGERGDAGSDPGEPTVLAYSLPHHPPPDDLGERGETNSTMDRRTDMVAHAI